jgi:hypothetical protein
MSDFFPQGKVPKSYLGEPPKMVELPVFARLVVLFVFILIVIGMVRQLKVNDVILSSQQKNPH